MASPFPRGGPQASEPSLLCLQERVPKKEKPGGRFRRGQPRPPSCLRADQPGGGRSSPRAWSSTTRAGGRAPLVPGPSPPGRAGELTSCLVLHHPDRGFDLPLTWWPTSQAGGSTSPHRWSPTSQAGDRTLVEGGADHPGGGSRSRFRPECRVIRPAATGRAAGRALRLHRCDGGRGVTGLSHRSIRVDRAGVGIDVLHAAAVSEIEPDRLVLHEHRTEEGIARRDVLR